MARFFGEVGYGYSKETPPDSGVWVDVIEEAPYQGDVIRQSRSLQSTDQLNDNLTLSNSISILADQFAIDHFSHIKYVRWSGVLWTVNSAEVRSPRLILNLGRVYNGPKI